MHLASLQTRQPPVFAPVFCAVVACAAAMCWAGTALAQGGYPDRAITLIVPFPPGGVADTVARPVAEALARELKQPVVVENKVGAGGAASAWPRARRPMATRCC